MHAGATDIEIAALAVLKGSWNMGDSVHPAAVDHLPSFITAPGQTDWLFGVVVVFLLAMILIVGNFYFQLHAIPEQMAHRGKKCKWSLWPSLRSCPVAGETVWTR